MVTKCSIQKSVLNRAETVRGKELLQKNIENVKDKGSFIESKLLKGDKHQERMNVAYMKRELYRASVFDMQKKRKEEIGQENLETADRARRAKSRKMSTVMFKALCKTFLMIRFMNECSRLVAFSNLLLSSQRGGA